MPMQRRHFTTALAGLPAAASAKAPRELLLAVATLPPYVLEVGHPAGDGIDVDIAREALRLGGGYRLRVERLPWRRVLAMLEQGEADLTAPVRQTPERRQFLAFSRGYGPNVQHDFYMRREAGLQLRKLSDLASLQVGVVAGFAFPPHLQAALGSQLEQAISLPTLLRMVAARRVDVAVVNNLPGRWLLQELGLGDQLLRQPLSHDSGDQTHMAVSRAKPDQEAILAALDRGLAMLARAPGGWTRFETPYLKPLPAPAALRSSGGGGSG
jgi:polar amino acid transport system substrate-binding protein